MKDTLKVRITTRILVVSKESSSIPVPLLSPEEKKEIDALDIKDGQQSVCSETEKTQSTSPETISNEFDIKYSALKAKINELIEIDRKRFAELSIKTNQMQTSKAMSDCLSSASHNIVVKQPKSPEASKDSHLWDECVKVTQSPEKLIQNWQSRNTNFGNKNSDSYNYNFNYNSML